ncbi:unnamed protein product [Rotaria sp. Silwood2]|nr:unnamed protein product [Rotaria sp. Silwood2]CAF3222585.1 unnamed protein product [Rotaria sp. Silwood2]CAF4115340.1 unnamed protein product [Rotaria sp. Silwood2]
MVTTITTTTTMQQSVIPNIPVSARWARNGVTVAGGDIQSDFTSNLWYPMGLVLADDQTMIIADNWNHRIIQWKVGDINGQVVAGGHGEGNQLDQLKYPSVVLIDHETNSLIICDQGNRRVVRWSRRSGTAHGEIILDDISCRGLAMDNQRYLYVSDYDEHEVRRYQMGDINGIIVAGGYGKGVGLHQLNSPTCLFVDQQQTVYVSDSKNNRVMKWSKEEHEGIMVAGAPKNTAINLYFPRGLFVDALGTVYVADSLNHRVMRWPQGGKQVTIIVDGYGTVVGPTQLNSPVDLLFDQHGNLYVVDSGNHRIQRFSMK